MSSIKYEEVVVHVDCGDADKNNIQSSVIKQREAAKKYPWWNNYENCELWDMSVIFSYSPKTPLHIPWFNYSPKPTDNQSKRWLIYLSDSFSVE